MVKASNILKGISSIGSVIRFHGDLVGTISKYSNGYYYVSVKGKYGITIYDVMERAEIEVISLNVVDDTLLAEYNVLVEKANTAHKKALDSIDNERHSAFSIDALEDYHFENSGYNDLADMVEEFEQKMIKVAQAA
ncbi:hypothetical protein BRE01_62550 [Brevibacillus reuszeri]|uniref:Uncharacterized protein n=1 Tax=Brevibacillus reuszeri TaxID=54915 RepID=A0A0K9YW86_9BACL|nr:hypothetical protein [Brevibacillus reuszeri]KNB72943.1 hypothetical protein ADS79_14050 [Brevibacillus reuszeri]GED72553.1 hypothetical protein BRE01_62550 [Brevibacillus reuszeri]